MDTPQPTPPATLLRVKPHIADLADGLQVRRQLPAAVQRSVGPFVFFDHFGPVTLSAATDSDVGSHPHIGLATVTYLFEGRQIHRDSLGTVQEIAPGAINWMTAGRGIVHSERTPDDLRGHARHMHGLQLWVALPTEQEECDPAFQHVAAADIPTAKDGAAEVRVLVGTAFGATSPVRAASPTLYLHVQLVPGTPWLLPALAEQMAIYSPEQPLQVAGEASDLPAGQLAVLPPGQAVSIQAAQPTRFVVIGGEALKAPRAMLWNFVATDRARVHAAAERWERGEFTSIPGETDRVEMPKRPG